MAKWKGEGPARSDTGTSIRGRISAPIPIDDDEFPIRSPGTGMATPLGNDGLDMLAVRGSTTSGRPASALSRDVSSTFPPAGQPYEGVPAPGHRAPQPSGLRNSELNEVNESNEPTLPNEKPPQRKKSTFKSAMSKLFGKKRKSVVPENNANPTRHEQHQSDPSAMMNMTRDTKSSSFSQKRTVSLPINEFNRALRSHSVDPNNLLEEPENEAQQNGHSIQAAEQTRPRGATIPSRIFTSSRGPGFSDFTGLSPRPVSSHARGSQVTEEVVENIGYAVTKGSHPNRRSRSLGQLREAAAANDVSRRRSDEIRYWRASYDQGALSPMSSNKADADEPLILDHPELPAQPQEPPQPFNFGPMGEMAGMKITQAASLDTRVSRLEERMIHMEKVISQFQHRAQMGHLQLQDPPKRNSRHEQPARYSRDLSLPNSKDQTSQNPATYNNQAETSFGSSRPSTTSTSNSYQPTFDGRSSPPSFLSSAPPTSAQDASRPLSTSTTIRGYPPSSPIISKSQPPTMDQIKTLTNMILAEQVARRNLEAQIQILQQQLAATKPNRKIPSYPTPGSEQIRNPLDQQHIENFSGFDPDDSSDDEDQYGTENFMTPKEEQDNFSSSEEHFIENDIRVPPRTMSLSQMTMKQVNGGVHPSINF
ncbi:hypothetical protein BP6252_05217 [Coleophoma cylindrospora]|uniref:Uncharacterized protein n=1 Tax=Coleophoma cylindrospora TaxID=1849047 RepID=A0A3D8RTI0_9HELO|nr:hypothetical protein BP6252_05217 [Coleophoma cylindrospora]